MDKVREQKILKTLKENDHKGVPFSKAKQKLLDAGYAEWEIAYCLYSASYDGKRNVAKKEHPLTKHYEKHPVEAEKIAKAILKDARKKPPLLSYFAASHAAPSPHSRGYYEVKLFDSLGLPYFTLFFIAVGLMVACLKFGWPAIIIEIYGAGVALLLVIKIWQHKRRLR